MDYAPIPADIFAELQEIAGPTYLWESWRENRRRTFSIPYLKRWLQRQVEAFCKETGCKKFTIHNFRDTCFTRAYDLGISLDMASVAFSCNPATMRKHYVRKDQKATADEVLARVQDAILNGAAGANKLLTDPTKNERKDESGQEETGSAESPKSGET